LFRIRKVKRASPFQATFSLFSEHSIGEQEHNQINLKKRNPPIAWRVSRLYKWKD
jgi:hypothetical protein